jgi:hypothetical protein
MELKSSWSNEVKALLESFEPLRGLLVREGPGLPPLLEGRLASLAPGQMGLSLKAAESGHWELVRGGFYYAANAMGRAHALFQNADFPEGAYWHGMLHRREGDFPNALYWVRRAGRIPELAGLAGFSPAAFVEACAAAAARGEEPPHLLEAQRREWEAMMLWSWRRLEALS